MLIIKVKMKKNRTGKSVFKIVFEKEWSWEIEMKTEDVKFGVCFKTLKKCGFSERCERDVKRISKWLVYSTLHFQYLQRFKVQVRSSNNKNQQNFWVEGVWESKRET